MNLEAMMRTVRRGSVVLAFCAAVLMAIAAPALAGGGGHGGDPCAGFTEGTSVALRDSCMDGASHFLPAGENLMVHNRGGVPHDYVAVDGSFETGLLDPGERGFILAPEPGVYRVQCTLHSSVVGRTGQGMTGVLVVGDGGVAGGAPGAVEADVDEGAAGAPATGAASTGPAERTMVVPATMREPTGVLGSAVLGLTALSLILAALAIILARRLRHPRLPPASP